MDKIYSIDDLRIFLMPRAVRTQADLERALKKKSGKQFKVLLGKTPEERGEYTVSKVCPVESHLCEWQPVMMEGVNCSFYNGIKGECVYPRTCTHNTSSEHFMNLYDRFMGNVRRYWDCAEEQKANCQISAKLKELGCPDDGWAYAEFYDDGKKVTLVELATDKDVDELLKKRAQEAKRNADYPRKQMLTELSSILNKYSLTTRKDIRRIIYLNNKIRGE